MYKFGFSTKASFAFLLQENIWELLEVTPLNLEKYDIFHYIDQIKVYEYRC